MGSCVASDEVVVARTVQWLDRAVIGLNLCPFAKAVHVKRQIRMVVSQADSVEALLADLIAELRRLAVTMPEYVETTLLMHPHVLGDFLDFNDFLELADAALEEVGLEDELQIASFHPDYQFAGTAPEDIGNFSNRSPFPTLHLLREASIDRAVEVFPEPERIYEANVETLRALGHVGWRALWDT